MRSLPLLALAFLAGTQASAAPPCASVTEAAARDSDVEAARADLERADAAILAFYPSAARQQGIEGSATLDCRLTSAGALTKCAVESESPSNEGFGAAALAIAARSPADADIQLPASQSRRVVFEFGLSPPTIEPNLALAHIVASPEWFAPAPKGWPPSRYYPARARRLGVGGKVVMDCLIAGDDTFTACEVASEAPTGFGFGQAAIRMAAHWRIGRANSLDHAGCRVIMPVRFEPPPNGTATPASSRSTLQKLPSGR